jgi:hypothetical protein
MTLLAKVTADISFQSYTTIQHGLTGAGQFGDTAPTDGAGGAGPYLVFENGIFKYPAQTSVGRVNIPANSGPIKLICVMADLGASTAWELHLTSDSNASGTPYLAADAAKYTDGDIITANATSRYIAKAYNFEQTGDGFLICPGQRVYLKTTAAVTGARVRFVFRRAFDTKA